MSILFLVLPVNKFLPQGMDSTNAAAVNITVEQSSPSSLSHFRPSSTCSTSHLTQTTRHTPLIPISADSYQLHGMDQEDRDSRSDGSLVDSLPPLLKRPRLDSGGMSQDAGLWTYASKNKPVGIAQPLPKRESIDETPSDLYKNEGEVPQKPKDMADLKKAGIVDGNLKSELDRDTTETARTSSVKNLPVKDCDGDSGTDSNSPLDYEFEPPSESSDDSSDDSKDGPSTNKSLGKCEEKQQNPSLHGVERMKLQKSPVGLPQGRKYHVFVTHSTADQQWVEKCVITPLSQNWRVKACYQLMPDNSQYDDRRIRDSMKQSCVIIIGLSPPYISSSRCKRELQLAVDLSSKVTVIVAAVSPCNRPEPLKRLDFLYLDFICKEKKKYVWDKLVRTIETTVQTMLAKEASHVERQKPTPSFNRGVSNSPSQDSQEDKDSQEEAGHMMAEFDAAWEETGGVDQGSTEYGDGVDSHTKGEGTDSPVEEESSGYTLYPGCHDVPNTPTSVLSSDQVQTPSANEEDQAPNDFGDSEESLETKHHHESDVEDGELSDSSGEVNRINSQEHDPNLSDVASFYNNLARPDADKRNQSPIRLMRNFNNWVKSVLIRSYLRQCPPGCTALDICCGKGGDLLKWKEGRIKHLVCADISSESIVAARERYHSEKMTGKGRSRPPFTADFYVADCTKEQLTKLQSSPLYYHISSCQFSVHYSFESYTNAHMMLRNACESLRPGGYFIGTTIDADQLVYRLQAKGHSENGNVSIGNNLFTVTLDRSLDVYKLPLFNARYNFRLHGVVDLPEYLVYFPLLAKMLEPFEMELVLRQNFYDFFEEHRYNSDDADLLYRMEAFDKVTGTMSQEQWEIVGLYLVYVFKKKPTSTQ